MKLFDAITVREPGRIIQGGKSDCLIVMTPSRKVVLIDVCEHITKYQWIVDLILGLFGYEQWVQYKANPPMCNEAYLHLEGVELPPPKTYYISIATLVQTGVAKSAKEVRLGARAAKKEARLAQGKLTEKRDLAEETAKLFKLKVLQPNLTPLSNPSYPAGFPVDDKQITLKKEDAAQVDAFFSQNRGLSETLKTKGIAALYLLPTFTKKQVPVPLLLKASGDHYIKLQKKGGRSRSKGR